MVDSAVLVAVVAAFVAGSLLKGVTGLGLPPVVLPVLTPVVGVEHAVAVLALPTVVGNGWLAWTNRQARSENPWLAVLAATATVGGIAGAYILVTVDERILAAVLVLLVLTMIVVRLRRPDWRLRPAVARIGAAPVGLVGGTLQGATGLSAAVVGTWTNALRLSRDGFVLTTSLMLQLASLSQAVTLLGLGALADDRLWQAGLACALVIAMLPVGQRLGRRLNQAWFDRLVLLVLLGSATGLLLEAL
ncbi:MAG: TSUP family transporter [Jiangellaceae bacterium]